MATFVLPADQSPGQVASATWADDVRAALGFLSNPPACRVYHNTTQSIADSAFTTLVFNSERYDTDGMHSTSVNTSRVTINTAGLYLFTVTLEFAAAADYSIVQAFIRHSNGTAVAWAEQDCNARNDTKRLVLSTVYKMSAAEYAEVSVFQDNSANAARNIGSGAATSPEFSATWIGLGA